MKPLKNGLSFSNWLLRISLMVLVVVTFRESFLTFDFKSKEFFLSLSFIVFGIFLFVGGFLSGTTLTVLSGFVLSGISIYKIVLLFSGSLNPIMATFLIILSIGFYFACSGNN